MREDSSASSKPAASRSASLLSSILLSWVPAEGEHRGKQKNRSCFEAAFVSSAAFLIVSATSSSHNSTGGKELLAAGRGAGKGMPITLCMNCFLSSRTKSTARESAASTSLKRSALQACSTCDLFSAVSHLGGSATGSANVLSCNFTPQKVPPGRISGNRVVNRGNLR